MRLLHSFSITLCFLWGLLIGISVQELTAQDRPINIGIIDTLRSDILNETRTIWIFRPGMNAEIQTAYNKYPVVYLLDGSTHFHSTSGVTEFLGSSGSSILPDMLVVGILNTNRIRDLTPTKSTTPMSDSSFTLMSGGGELFLDFIEKELIPYVEKNYNANSYRSFIGHSLGGLLVLHSMLTRPGLFKNHIAIDPSIWWDDATMLNTAPDILEKITFDDSGLYLGIANANNTTQTPEEIRQDTSMDMDHTRSIFLFADILDSILPDGLNFRWKYYEEDDHGSAPLITTYDAFRFLFSWYQMPELDRFFIDPDSPIEELIGFLKEHFQQMSNKLGYDISPPEGLINSLGYAMMQNGMMKKSLALFKWNVELYPTSANVYDSLGDHYSKAGKIDQAISAYEKTLEIMENPITRKKLEDLK